MSTRPRKTDGRILSGIIILLALAALLRAGCSMAGRRATEAAHAEAAARADSIMRRVESEAAAAARDSLRPAGKGRAKKAEKPKKEPQRRSFLDEEVPARAD